jgi:hypothetical protein
MAIILMESTTYRECVEKLNGINRLPLNCSEAGCRPVELLMENRGHSLRPTRRHHVPTHIPTS